MDQPHYVVHSANAALEALRSSGGGGAAAVFRPGAPVYTVKSRAAFVTLASVVAASRRTGCDASNEHDEEPGPDEREYSDDEEERAVKVGTSRPRGGLSPPMPWR